MKGQRDLGPHAAAAAAAAARRLSSNRPLYAVSLSTAVSRLLQPTPTPESASPCSPFPTPSSSSSSQTGNGALRLERLRAQDRPLGQAAEGPQREQRTRVATDQEVTEQLQAQWLTSRFVAQVRAHFEATLAASSQEGGEEAQDGGEEAQASEGEEEEKSRYQRSVCTAALNWGLLLLLSAELALLSEATPPPMPQASANGSPGRQNESCFSSQKSCLEAEVVNCNQQDNAESADTVLREALFAFEIIVRVSPATATRVLPKILEWLDWGLSGRGGQHPILSEGAEADSQQVHDVNAVLQNAEADAWESPLERRVQQIRAGFLSVLFTCPLPNCVASGSILSPSEHLNRIRLLALLLRGPRVLLECSRVIAACVMPPKEAKGVCESDGSGSIRGTAPVAKLEGDNAKAVTELEASQQRRLCAETVGQLLAAMKDLRAALFPDAQADEPRQTLALQQKYGDIESLGEVEKMILAACLPPMLRWVFSPSQHTTQRSQTGHPSVLPANKSLENSIIWAFAETHLLATEDTPRKAALYILATIQGLLLSFALNVQGSPKCLDTFGVAAAATDESVVRRAQALLKEVGEFFSLRPNTPVGSYSLELPPGTFIHAVTGLCSRALTAKELPKAFQVNPNRADSRILLTATAAASAIKVQMAERGGGRDPRCPLSGRLQLPEGLPDEQLAPLFPGHVKSGHSAVSEGAGRVLLSYLSDEGAFRMAIHVSRILTALVKSISLGDGERNLGFIIPPLLRILDVPQAEVRFLGWKCLNEVAISCTVGALNNYRTPIMQALMGGFPIYTEVDVCFDAYLEAFTTFVCRTFADEYDQSFFDCQNFLIDMSHPALNSSESLRLAFLRRSRPLLVFARDSANLRLCDWMNLCLDALESISTPQMTGGSNVLSMFANQAWKL
ncbi:hypothetical protein, conserved [Eimeria praecox]|uniref:Uncharacterized protein n=1 Tax=Eimeria praecox TaxID=51316 RepID=U6G9T6_9EIME|nr:hypothetical protein, conserved [Eimeria praecox]